MSLLRLALANFADRRREVKAKKSTSKCDAVYRGFNYCPHYQGIHNRGDSSKNACPVWMSGTSGLSFRAGKISYSLARGKGPRQV